MSAKVATMESGTVTLGITLTTADGTALAGRGLTFNLTQLVVRITSPGEGDDFVVDPDAPATVVAEASWTDSTTVSTPSWTVTPGPHSGAAPPPGAGREFAFVPHPEAHSATYEPGWDDNSCGTCGAAWWIAEGNAPDERCGNGCNGHVVPPSPRFSYRITADLDGGTRSVELVQDEVDAILQQYVEHRRLGSTIPVPARREFTPATVGGGYWGDVFRLAKYKYALGDPEPFANDVLAAYRQYANDEELVPNAYQRPVGAGVPFLRSRRGIPTPTGTFDLPLRTPLCWDGTAVVPNCGDVEKDGVISAGPSGIAHTRRKLVNYNLAVKSGWRSPEHNEAMGGVLSSQHQRGNALDLKPKPGEAKPSSDSNTWCLLRYAAGTVKRPNMVTFTQAENRAASGCPCTDPITNHVHVDVR
jgi:hypothetical protein